MTALAEQQQQIIGFARANRDGLVTSVSGCIAHPIAVEGQSVFQDGLLCGMQDYVHEQVIVQRKDMIFQNVALRHDECGTTADIVICHDAEQDCWCITAYKPEGLTRREQADLQRQRSKRMFAGMAGGLDKHADTLRKVLRKKIDAEPETPGTGETLNLWRIERLANEFAGLAKDAK